MEKTYWIKSKDNYYNLLGTLAAAKRSARENSYTHGETIVYELVKLSEVEKTGKIIYKCNNGKKVDFVEGEYI